MKRFQARRGNGRFQRNTPENTLGLSVHVHERKMDGSWCGGLNPTEAGGPAPKTCGHCGEPLRQESAPPADGEVVDGLRWCASCARFHGALFLCPSYSSEIRAQVDADRGHSFSPAGSGVGQILAPFAARGVLRGGRG